MSIAAMVGADVLKIDALNVTDGINQDWVSLEYPEDLVQTVVGKNGNVVHAVNEQGKLVNLTVRVVRGSKADQTWNARLAGLVNDPAGFVFIQGEFIKNIGDGTGAKTQEVYILQNGILSKGIGGKSNSNGDTEQAVATWNFKFVSAVRYIG